MAGKYSHLIVDVETVPDGALIGATKYPELGLTSAEAIERFRGELKAKTGSDFIPYAYCLPAAIVVAGLGDQLELKTVVAIGAPRFDPAVLVTDFWKGYVDRRCPTLVTFNGRRFDLPVLELAAYRYGIPIQEWWARRGRFDKSQAHVDLFDEVSNKGASALAGGLDLLANLIGKPGKFGPQGGDVLGLWQAGRKQEIADYCTCDVLDTYFVFLRCELLIGKLSRETEQWLTNNAHEWMAKHASGNAGVKAYLERWGGPS